MRILVLAALLAACGRPQAPAAGSTPAVFEDVAERAGIRFRHFQGRRSSLLPEDMGSGACWGDVDGDGRLDLYLVNAAPLDPSKAELGARARNALYRSRGDGTFEEYTDTAEVAGRGLGMGCLFVDLENKGRPDLLVTGYEGTILYRNEGNWRFTEVTKAAGLADARWSSGACAADYDGDGRLDLYVPRYVEFRRDAAPKRTAVERGGFAIPVTLSPFAFPPVGGSLYHNEGGGRFSDVAARSGAANKANRALQCLFADLDEDGRPDLYIADDVGPDVLLRNAGGGRFLDATSQAWLGDVKSSMGLAPGDFDRDGDVDLAVTEWIAHEKSLYINLLRERKGLDKPGHRLHFADGNAPAGLGEATLDNVGWGVVFLDYDNDGWPDLLIANGSTFEDREHPERLVGQRLQLFHNNGDGTFTDVSASAGPAFQARVNARGLAAADYDGDGKVDAVVNVNGGAPLLLRNVVKNDNHWLELKLRGTRSNRDAVGARVVVRTGDGRTQTCLVTAGGSYLSMSSLVCHFGLGRFSRAEGVQVFWPSGAKQDLGALAGDRLWGLDEGGRAR